MPNYLDQLSEFASRVSYHRLSDSARTAAAARLMDFNPHQMRGVINLSASMSPANTWTPCFQGATIRNVYPGRSGMQGVLAPQLLLCGFTPPSDAPTDVYTTILGDEFHPEATVAGLGSGPLRIEQNYFKFHACCLYNHPVLDAIQSLADRVSIISDPSMDLQNPDKPCARVDVALSDGRTFSESTTFHRGDFQRRRSRIDILPSAASLRFLGASSEVPRRGHRHGAG